MRSHTDLIRQQLAIGGSTPSQLIDLIKLSQPSLSRALRQLGPELIRVGAARSIQYFLRDSSRDLPDLSIHRVDQNGVMEHLGQLVPVRPDGFITIPVDGKATHSEGLPWWLHDMRPQGYLGRAYAMKYAHMLGVPASLNDWSDTHALRAMLLHGHDLVGNLLVGNIARDRFVQSTTNEPVSTDQKQQHYTALAQQAANGEPAGSSAGGEQPKFTAYAKTSNGPRHVIVKFSEIASGPVTERWRDLLLAEHLALVTLREAGISAARSHVIDSETQRFLEVERFDRVGEAGRRGIHSLAALDAAFIGSGNGSWPIVTRALANEGRIDAEAAAGAELLWAFGTLIGNTDMHLGNLSFIDEQGPPYSLAPAYDMTPMGFRPRSSGGLSNSLSTPALSAAVSPRGWQQAFVLAEAYFERIRHHQQFSARFEPCMTALRAHLDNAQRMLRRLA